MSIIDLKCAFECNICMLALSTNDIDTFVKCRKSGKCVTLMYNVHIKPTEMNVTSPPIKIISKYKPRIIKPVNEWSVNALKNKCKELGITGFSRSTHKERTKMIELIQSYKKNNDIVKKDSLAKTIHTIEYISLQEEVEEYEIIEEIYTNKSNDVNITNSGEVQDSDR